MIIRHVFLLTGVLTLGLFFLVEGLDRAGKTDAAQALAGPIRILIVPMYVVRLLLTMAQVAIAAPSRPPVPIAAVIWIIKMIAGLAPYALADYVLERSCRVTNRLLSRH